MENLIPSKMPSIFCIQETHMKRASKIDFTNLNKYQIYELIRDSKNGGGLAPDIINYLQPGWIKYGGEEVEAMTVKVIVKEMSIHVANAYGPQEYNNSDMKDKFWQYMKSLKAVKKVHARHRMTALKTYQFI